MAVERVAVGRITRAHGVQGEVAVQVHTDVPGRFAPGSVLGLEDSRSLTVESSRPHGDRVLVRFREVAGRDAAEALRGAYVFVAASELPPLPEGHFWPHEIEGCEVLTEEGRALGRVVEVLQGPANDVWVAEGAGGRTLVPAIREAVVSVDTTGGTIVVREDRVG
jgi:16S rRNA processing protein RimM